MVDLMIYSIGIWHHSIGIWHRYFGMFILKNTIYQIKIRYISIYFLYLHLITQHPFNSSECQSFLSYSLSYFLPFLPSFSNLLLFLFIFLLFTNDSNRHLLYDRLLLYLDFSRVFCIYYSE
jgi:hypothetical protein